MKNVALLIYYCFLLFDFESITLITTAILTLGIVNFEKLLVWDQLSTEYSSAAWKCFQTPSWFGFSDDFFRSVHFDAEGLIRSWFEIREVSQGDVRKVIAGPHKNQPFSNAAKNGENKVVEDEFNSEEDDEDYDVDDLLQDRIMDDIFAEADSKQGQKLGAGVVLSYVAELSVHNLDKNIKYMQSDLTKAREDRTKNQNSAEIIIQLENALKILQNKRIFLDSLFNYYRAGRIELPNVDDLIAELKACRISEMILLPRKERWALYLAVVQRARVLSAERACEVGKELAKVQKKLREIQMMADSLVLQNAKVVGMTTTGAAKFNAHVQMMRSKIGESDRMYTF